MCVCVCVCVDLADKLLAIRRSLAVATGKLQSKRHFESNMSDQLSCFSDFEPRAERRSSLSSIVINNNDYNNYNHNGMQPHRKRHLLSPLHDYLKGLPNATELFEASRMASSAAISSVYLNSNFSSSSSNNSSLGWVSNVYEILISANNNFPRWLYKSQENGYSDFKFVLSGNVDSGPISMVMTLKTSGYVFLCEPPGVSKGNDGRFDRLWDGGQIYFTDLSMATELAPTLPSKSTEHTCFNTKSLDVCCQIEKKLTKGKKVLTIIPKSTRKIALSYIITP